MIESHAAWEATDSSLNIDSWTAFWSWLSQTLGEFEQTKVFQHRNAWKNIASMVGIMICACCVVMLWWYFWKVTPISFHACRRNRASGFRNQPSHVIFLEVCHYKLPLSDRYEEEVARGIRRKSLLSNMRPSLISANRTVDSLLNWYDLTISAWYNVLESNTLVVRQPYPSCSKGLLPMAFWESACG